MGEVVLCLLCIHCCMHEQTPPKLSLEKKPTVGCLYPYRTAALNDHPTTESKKKYCQRHGRFESLYIVRRNINRTVAMEKQFHMKWNIELLYGLSLLLEKLEARTQTGSYRPLIMTALFTGARRQKLPQGPPAGECINSVAYPQQNIVSLQKEYHP